MNVLTLTARELGRLLRGRLTWLVLGLTALSPAAGLTVLRFTASETMLSRCVADPAMAAGVLGGLLFALLTLWDSARAPRSRVEVLTDAAVSPLTTALTRLLTLLTAAVLTAGLTMLVWLPISAGLIGSVFTVVNFLLAYLQIGRAHV